MEEEFGSNLIKEHSYSQDQYEVLDLDQDFKIINISQINDQISCLVIENVKTRLIRFLSLKRIDSEDGQSTLQLA